ncbi:MAG: glycosyltransferase family 39 protein [Lewinellaceae bacterium]|nr:glycosyltransferase family 39 protein [Phaeodactylibacter sp.]MCB9041114.1 glycosyltransferase family 39 protein [Lewinellaceae bacterium]
MDRPAEGKRWLWGLLSAWALANIFQAALTELDPDEAYYWMYSLELDWGYFDHPPAVALLIRAGTLLFSGELGVRFFFVLLQPLSVYFLWRLAGRPSEKWDVITFIGLLAAIPILEIYGFVATPDGPLLFFAALFLWLYKQFVEGGRWPHTVLLGVCMAALLYSKYHGVLLIFFVLLSNLSLLKKPSFYVASILGFLLFLPHLHWQYENGFPSFLYHLQGRDDVYKLKYTTTYLLNQMVIFSPFLFPMLLWVLWKRRAEGPMDRACRFLLYGFWAFFFYTSFKGHVEPQWTGILSFPIALILFEECRRNLAFARWVRIFSLVTVLLLLAARLELAFNWTGLKSEFHRRQWVYELQQQAAGHPVLFHNTYRDVSKYSFYAGEKAYAFSDIEYRPNQFDLWDWERELHNKTVLLAAQNSWKCTACERVELTRKSFKLQLLDSLQVAEKVQCFLPDTLEKEWKAGGKLAIPIRFFNPYPHDIDFQKGTLPLSATGVFLLNGVLESYPLLRLNGPSPILPAGDTTAFEALFSVPDTLAGPFQFGIGLSWDALPPDVKSRLVEVVVE